MTKPKQETPAEEIRRLLGELHGELITREKVPHYRSVRRAADRTVAVLDWRTHVVREPGLLTQLGVTTTRHATVPVQVYRWERTDCPCREKTDRCRHDRRVFQRIEQRPAPVINPGATIPSGSPGWDADGALTPLVAGSPDPGEPITDAWHAADDIRHELVQLGRELHEEGWRAPNDTLVSIALDDVATGEWIAARLRALVSRARVAADYDAPAVPLRDVHCRYCGGQLWVRADASSAVWCSGWLPILGPAAADDPDWSADCEEWGPVGFARCGRSWPRGSWVALLAEAERREEGEEVRAS
ncbi:hypothetical protein [Actinomadura sp. GTD37]|uniref:hypothetical protein n=1 Tax=Actinomadura sp. GTD37 TaxID=1778030 RepID=UPI0035BFC103